MENKRRERKWKRIKYKGITYPGMISNDGFIKWDGRDTVTKSQKYAYLSTIKEGIYRDRKDFVVVSIFELMNKIWKTSKQGRCFKIKDDDGRYYLIYENGDIEDLQNGKLLARVSYKKRKLDKTKYYKKTFEKFIGKAYNDTIKCKIKSSMSSHSLYYEIDKLIYEKIYQDIIDKLNEMGIDVSMKFKREWKNLNIRGKLTNYSVSNDGMIKNRLTGELIDESSPVVILEVINSVEKEPKKFKVDRNQLVLKLFGKSLYDDFRPIELNPFEESKYEINRYGVVRIKNTGKILEHTLQSHSGLHLVSLYKKPYSVANLVYKHFIGEPYSMVYFKDGNNRNCFVDNLYCKEDRSTMMTKEEKLDEYAEQLTKYLAIDKDKLEIVIHNIKQILF